MANIGHVLPAVGVTSISNVQLLDQPEDSKYLPVGTVPQQCGPPCLEGVMSRKSSAWRLGRLETPHVTKTDCFQVIPNGRELSPCAWSAWSPPPPMMTQHPPSILRAYVIWAPASTQPRHSLGLPPANPPRSTLHTVN